MATVMSSSRTERQSMVGTVVAGVVAGLVGGAVFGMMMGMMGMLPMVAMLVGSESVIVGFLVHMVISAGIGGSYGLLASRLPMNAATGIVAGALYGTAWWILGALLLMPILLGMPQMVLQIGDAQMFSLMGHIIFGVITGLIFVPILRRM